MLDREERVRKRLPPVPTDERNDQLKAVKPKEVIIERVY